MSTSVSHGTFTVEREFPVPLDRIWAAWATAEQKSGWFAQEPGFIKEVNEYSLDFRVGGTETLDAILVGGQRLQLATVYGDIVPKERIIGTYEVLVNGRRISVSLWTTEFVPTANGTRLITTEHGAYLDGLDSNEDRIKGVEADYEQLGLYFERLPS
jgi:uncharacterized protein YndB with AHSA1/START domain